MVTFPQTTTNFRICGKSALIHMSRPISHLPLFWARLYQHRSCHLICFQFTLFNCGHSFIHVRINVVSSHVLLIGIQTVVHAAVCIPVRRKLFGASQFLPTIFVFPSNHSTGQSGQNFRIFWSLLTLEFLWAEWLSERKGCANELESVQRRSNSKISRNTWR